MYIRGVGTFVPASLVFRIILGYDGQDSLYKSKGESRMEEQSRFLEMLQGIKEIAGAQQNQLTKEEIKKYLGEEGLSEVQMDAVYHYLGENHIKVEGYTYIPDKAEGKKAVTGQTGKEKSFDAVKAAGRGKKAGSAAKESRREANMRLYRQELAKVADDLEEAEELILSFLHGDFSVKGTIVEKYLRKVTEIARSYKKRNVPMDEVIAEGNVGLMVAMQIIEQNRMEYILPNGSLDFEKFFGTLNLEVSHAIETYIDEMTASKDWENAMLAKTNLLHEATKYMADEIGRIPTIDELSEYTRISREEIKDIMGLSEDAKRVASAE